MNSDRGTLRIVVLSGPVGSGKSALAENLKARHGARIIKTRDSIRQRLPNVKEERGALQRAGERLDREDDGAWVRDALVRFVEAEGDSVPKGLFVLDSVRIAGQLDAVRQAYGPALHHIHLTAETSVLAERYAARDAKTREFSSYEEVKRSRTEQKIEDLANIADILVATDRCNPDAVLVRATALLGLYSRSAHRLVDVLIGGQYGSEGKGNIVGHIAPEYDLLVRVGGPNAGHKVFAEPEAEVYHHLPSGTACARRCAVARRGSRHLPSNAARGDRSSQSLGRAAID